MPTIDLTDDELAAVAAAIRRAIKEDRFPLARRLDQLRSALANFEAGYGGAQRPQAGKNDEAAPAAPTTQRPPTDIAGAEKLVACARSQPGVTFR
jgi:hypothetical protein